MCIHVFVFKCVSIYVFMSVCLMFECMCVYMCLCVSVCHFVNLLFRLVSRNVLDEFLRNVMNILKPLTVVIRLLLFDYYTTTKSWRGYIFIAVCLCVCVCVRVCLSVNKIQAELMHQFGRGFR